MSDVHILTALQSLASLERDFARTYGLAAYRAQQATLDPQTKSTLHGLRNEVFQFQQTLYTRIANSPLGSVPGLLSRIPAPRRWPDLPMPGQPLPPEFKVQGPRTTRGFGLGNPVVIVVGGVTITLGAALAFAIVAVVAIAAFAAIAYGVYVSAELVRRIVSTREISQRYYREIQSAERRYEDCRNSGNTAEHCNQVAPIPATPIADALEPIAGSPTSPLLWGAIGIAGAAILIGGIYAYGRGKRPSNGGAASRALTAGSV